jgi:hypothetical protein
MADKLGRCPTCKARMVSKTMCEHGHEAKVGKTSGREKVEINGTHYELPAEIIACIDRDYYRPANRPIGEGRVKSLNRQ